MVIKLNKDKEERVIFKYCEPIKVAKFDQWQNKIFYLITIYLSTENGTSSFIIPFFTAFMVSCMNISFCNKKFIEINNLILI